MCRFHVTGTGHSIYTYKKASKAMSKEGINIIINGDAAVASPTSQGYIMTEPTNSSVDENIGISTSDRIVYQTGAVSMALAASYVVLALLKYNWMKANCVQKKNGKNIQTATQVTVQTSESLTSNSAAGSGKSKTTSEKDTRVLRKMSLAAASFTFIRIACEQLELAPANEHRVDCRDYQVAMVVTYCISLSTLYAILWYRVKVFLSHPAMRHLGSKILNVLAYIVLSLIGLASVANSVMFLVSTISEDSVGGCMVLSPGNIVSNTARFAVLTVSTVVFQISLLALFLYPLIRHRAAMKACKMSSQSTIRRKSSSSVRGAEKRKNSSIKVKERKFKRQRAIVKVIRRVMVTAVLCAVSDIFCGLIVQVVVEKPRIVTNLIFDANLLINLGCVLASFRDWRLRLFPCCPKRRTLRRRNSEWGIAKSSSIHPPTYARENSCQVDTSLAVENSKTSPILCSSESGIHSIPEPSISDLIEDQPCQIQGQETTKCYPTRWQPLPSL